MGALEFVAEMVKALAWPAFAIALVVAFRRPIKDLIPFMRKFKYGDFEAEFGQQVRAIQEEIGPPRSSRWLTRDSETRTLYKRDATIPMGRAGELRELAQANPRLAVLEAWRDVEEALRDAAAHLSQGKIEHEPDEALRRVAKEMEPKEVALYYELRKLRNQVAHVSDRAPSPEAALQYVGLCFGLVAVFRRFAGENDTRVLY
jgi:hypothetical protein